MEKLLKITKQRIKNHLHYGKRYYLIAIIAVIATVNIIYTTTAPKYPKENTVSIMMYTGTIDEDAADIWQEEMLNLLSDDQRAVEIVSSVSADITTQPVVVVRIAAKEDDILVMSEEEMITYASQGSFLPLDEYMDLDKVYNMYPDIDWSKYEVIYEELGDTESHIYWLPLDMVEGLSELGFSGEGMGIGIVVNSVNVDNTITCFEYIISK